MARDACIANGLMVRGIRDSLVMCPPLIITTEQIDEMVAIIRKSLDEVLPKLRAAAHRVPEAEKFMQAGTAEKL